MGTARDLVVGSGVWPAWSCNVSNFCTQSSLEPMMDTVRAEVFGHRATAKLETWYLTEKKGDEQETEMAGYRLKRRTRRFRKFTTSQSTRSLPLHEKILARYLFLPSRGTHGVLTRGRAATPLAYPQLPRIGLRDRVGIQEHGWRLREWPTREHGDADPRVPGEAPDKYSCLAMRRLSSTFLNKKTTPRLANSCKFCPPICQRVDHDDGLVEAYSPGRCNNKKEGKGHPGQQTFIRHGLDCIVV